MSTEAILTEKRSYLGLGLLLLITILIRLPILAEPWGADQAGYAYSAIGMLEGKVPYKDLYSLAGYGIIFTYALFFKLFGVNMVSIHIGHLLVSVFSVILVYYLTHHIYGDKAAFIAALCCTIFSNGLAFSGFGYENKSAWGTYWYLSQREVFIAPLITGAVFLQIISERKNGIFIQFITGALLGLAASQKFTVILMLFLFTGLIAWEGWTKHRSFYLLGVVKKSFALLLGFFLIQLPFLLYLWMNDALREMYQALFVHVSLYARLSRGLRIETLFSGHYSILSENLILWLFSAISVLYIIFKDRNRNNLLIVLWCLFSLGMVWGQGKFFGYHFIILVPPFSVLTAYGLKKFLTNGSGLRHFFACNLSDIKKTFMLTTVVFTLLSFCVSNYEYYKTHISLIFGKKSKEEYYQVFSEFPTHPYSFRSDLQIVEYLQKSREPNDRLGIIFSAGDTIIHFLTNMRSATRFIQSWYLFPSDDYLAKHEITTHLRKQFVDQLIKSSPRFILCVHIPLNELVEIPSLKDDPTVSRLNQFVQSNYRVKAFPDNRFLFVRI